ncbi:arylsulfatase [Holotrichia oblita]|uniref:Arylsulfatase n=1 Tax=Holotrichia oblita TaxID=644536 RepID=A0ACB9T830_HOLOL|nr:arylsulfatase [Holotrichia oblita]
MQHRVLYGAEPRGLPLSEVLLPEYLKKLGYTNRIVGKWHLGSWKLEYTPTFRGFDSHLGFWTGHHDYNDHTAMETDFWGLDMRNNTEVAWDLHGQYSTDIFTQEAVKLISTHNQSKPLFLYLAHTAVHSGNPYNPLAAPDNIVANFANIDDFNRRKFAGMLTKLDESVGRVVEALAKAKMLENSIIVFSTDNGGPAAGFNLNAASNWPLRGVKNTLWEGGVRGAGLIWSPLIKQSMRVSNQMIHISDWLPTLLTIANQTSIPPNIDGFNVWSSISNAVASPRSEILHNIDDKYGNAALTIDDWKLLKGTTYEGAWDNWYGPSGRNETYNTTMVRFSLAGLALQSINRCASEEQINKIRKEAEVKCPPIENVACKPLEEPCLFNIKDDPCELQNLAKVHPAILSKLLTRLNELNSTVVPPGNLPNDSRGNPKYWDYTWTNFGDYFSTTSANVILNVNNNY